MIDLNLSMKTFISLIIDNAKVVFAEIAPAVVILLGILLGMIVIDLLINMQKKANGVDDNLQ